MEGSRKVGNGARKGGKENSKRKVEIEIVKEGISERNLGKKGRKGSQERIKGNEAQKG